MDCRRPIPVLLLRAAAALSTLLFLLWGCANVQSATWGRELCSVIHLGNHHLWICCHDSVSFFMGNVDTAGGSPFLIVPWPDGFILFSALPLYCLGRYFIRRARSPRPPRGFDILSH